MHEAWREKRSSRGRNLFGASVARQMLSFLLVTGALCTGAEQRARPALEKYLQRLGYIAVPMEVQEGNKMMVRLEMEGKRRTFCVDTGFSMTAVDSLPGRKLKTLGELGAELDDSFLGHITNREFVLM